MEEHQAVKFDEDLCVICSNDFEMEHGMVKFTRELTNLIKFIELHVRDELHE